jgi:hypothetical protein
MKLSDAFPSKYLTAEDIEDGDRTLTITSARAEVLGEGPKASNKIILAFREEKKELVCNKTNANTIAKIHGDDTDDWIGKPITLYATEVEFGGEVTLGIRVRLRSPKPAAAAAGPFKSVGDGVTPRDLLTKFAELTRMSNPDATDDDIKKGLRERIAADFDGKDIRQLGQENINALALALDAEILF